MGRILVIDDEEAIRDLLQRALVSAGHEVITANDGSEGLRNCIQTSPDLVLIDLYLPDCDGVELISNLRKRFPKLPIFAMSGQQLADDLLRMVKLLGGKKTFRKPFVIAELLVAVEEALRE